MRYLRDVQTVLTALCGLALAASFFPELQNASYLAVLFGSYFALKSAWDSLSAREVDVNLLMVLAAAGAVAVGAPRDAAALLFLFSLSSTLEALAMARTKSAIEGLVKLRPDEAILIESSGDRKVRVEELRKGSLIRVLPFEHIPADGIVAEGSSSVNQAAMTGESQPVSKHQGEPVLAGTQNLEGMLVVNVTSEVGDSTLEKIVSLVREAQEHKASGEKISTWFGQRYTFFVLAAFAVSFIVRVSLGADLSTGFYASLTLLVALSPCALVISVPATTLTALAWGARKGMLIRGGEYIERAGQIDTLAVDKTGTLTTGKPELVEICVCSAVERVGAPGACVEETSCWKGDGDLSEEAQSMLRMAAAAEQYSTHPIAEAIVRSASNRGIEVPEATGASAVPGFGVHVTIDEVRVRVGQRRFFEQGESRLDRHFAEHVESIQAKGMTVVIVSAGDRFAALGLRDAPRPEAPAFLEALKQYGIKRVVMLTGDTEQTARAIAGELRITEYRAGLLPEDKTRVLDQLSSEGAKVMMIGDGINDAPSLARASVGVAMGGLGSDVALNSADVVLMHDRLDRVPQLLRLGKRTNAIIRTNLLFASGVIVILSAFSLVGTLPLPIAVIGHEGSTVLVILNGLRLLRRGGY
jgi:Cd2+/Zn2+-exporting ATPase